MIRCSISGPALPVGRHHLGDKVHAGPGLALLLTPRGLQNLFLRALRAPSTMVMIISIIVVVAGPETEHTHAGRGKRRGSLRATINVLAWWQTVCTKIKPQINCQARLGWPNETHSESEMMRRRQLEINIMMGPLGWLQASARAMRFERIRRWRCESRNASLPSLLWSTLD